MILLKNFVGENYMVYNVKKIVHEMTFFYSFIKKVNMLQLKNKLKNGVVKRNGYKKYSEYDLRVYILR